MSDPSKSVAAACSAAALLLVSLDGAALAQAPAPSADNATQLPSVTVTAPRVTRAPRRPQEHVATKRRSTTTVTTAQQHAPAPSTTPSETANQVLAGQNDKLDSARQNGIFPPIGANSYEVTHQTIEAMPQGNNATLDKVLLQFPGVTQDSAASGELHVRNEHANVQYRINGIMLPDGVGAFGQILDTGIVGSLALLTGALPAQYGLHTAGVLDIQTKADAFNNTGSVNVYGGSHGNITTSLEYGGTVGQTQYYVSGRYLTNDLGIENPTPAYNAIHDNTDQEKGF